MDTSAPEGVPEKYLQGGWLIIASVWKACNYRWLPKVMPPEDVNQWVTTKAPVDVTDYLKNKVCIPVELSLLPAYFCSCFSIVQDSPYPVQEPENPTVAPVNTPEKQAVASVAEGLDRPSVAAAAEASAEHAAAAETSDEPADGSSEESSPEPSEQSAAGPAEQLAGGPAEQLAGGPAEQLAGGPAEQLAQIHARVMGQPSTEPMQEPAAASHEPMEESAAASANPSDEPPKVNC